MYILKFLPFLLMGLSSLGAGGLLCPSGIFAVTQEELSTLKKDAIAGNRNATNRIISYYGFYKNDQEEKKRWLAISALQKEKSAIKNLNIMKVSISKILLLSPEQQEILENTDLHMDPSAVFFLYANFLLQDRIVEADAMLHLIQEQRIEISPALLNELEALCKEDQDAEKI